MDNSGAVSAPSSVTLDPTIGILHEAARGSSLEGDQIANNIANVNTPNFRRSQVSFKEALAESLGTPASTDGLALVTDSDRQFNVDGAVPPGPYDPKAAVDETTQMRVDRSNVDIDQEMAQLEENSGYKQSLQALIKKQYSWLREAITEQAQ